MAPEHLGTPDFHRQAKGESSDAMDPKSIEAAKVLSDSGHQELANEMYRKGWEKNRSPEGIAKRGKLEIQSAASGLKNLIPEMEKDGFDEGYLHDEYAQFDAIGRVRKLLAAMEEMYRVKNEKTWAERREEIIEQYPDDAERY